MNASDTAGAATVTGRIHSLESLGTRDGPGLRFVVFMQGCLYRCLYCHNPDTWTLHGGRLWDSADLFAEVAALHRYYRPSGGGVTVSGGEPLLQARFVTDLFRRCRAAGIHTALDTAGGLYTAPVRRLLEHTDLVLLDVKSVDAGHHRRLTGRGHRPFQAFLAHLERCGPPLWIRYVLVPGWTDAPALLHATACRLASCETLQRVEILPYHRLGRYKWEALEREFPLAGVPEPGPERVVAVAGLFREYGLPVA